jgi:transcriptional regulator with XRE-family HTH domain
MTSKRYVRPRKPYASIYHWLEGTGHTQKDLAEMAGLSQQHVANVLRKTRICSFAVALKLSRICNVPLESIATDEQLSGKCRGSRGERQALRQEC